MPIHMVDILEESRRKSSFNELIASLDRKFIPIKFTLGTDSKKYHDFFDFFFKRKIRLVLSCS